MKRKRKFFCLSLILFLMPHLSQAGNFIAPKEQTALNTMSGSWSGMFTQYTDSLSFPITMKAWQTIGGWDEVQDIVFHFNPNGQSTEGINVLCYDSTDKKLNMYQFSHEGESKESYTVEGDGLLELYRKGEGTLRMLTNGTVDNKLVIFRKTIVISKNQMEMLSEIKFPGDNNFRMLSRVLLNRDK